MDPKALLADLMGHFTPHDIVLAVLGLFAAALLAFLTGLLSRADNAARKHMAKSAAVMAFAVSFAHVNVPVAIALVAAALLLQGDKRVPESVDPVRRFAALAIGVGCGASSAAIVAILIIPLGLILRWGNGDR